MNSSISTILVVSSIIGIAAYGASAAYQSWERRNDAIRRRIKHSKYYFASRRFKKLLIAAGVAGILISVVSNFSMKREGLLYANNISVLDTPESLKPTWVTNNKAVKKGELVAKFQPADPSLQVQKTAIRNNRFSKEADLNDKISTLKTQINSIKNESQISKYQLELAQQKKSTALRLVKQGALSEDVYKERESEILTIKQKIIQSEDSLLLTKARLNKLSNALNQLKADADLNENSNLNNSQYDTYSKADRNILFRSNSLSANSDLPLLVFGNDQSMLLQVRLANHEAQSLSKSKKVYAEWIEGRKANSVTPLSYTSGIPKRFEVSVSEIKELDGDNDHKLAFLVAQVPPRAVSDIARDKVVPARLIWQPSLYFNPTFRVSSAVLFAGILLSMPLISYKTITALNRRA